MRTTVELPDATFRRLKSQAAQRGTTLKQLVRAAVEKELAGGARPTPTRRVKLPLLKSKQPGALRLTNAQVEDLLA